MADPLSAVIRAAEKTAELADALGKVFARQLASVLRDTERRLGPLLREVTAGNRTAIVKAAQANRIRKDLREALTNAGYDELANLATADPLDRMASSVLSTRRLAQQSADLTRGMELRLNGLKALQYTDLLDEGQQVSRALWKATIRGVFGSQDAETILRDLGDVLDQSAPRIQTLYDTSVSIYGRQVEALQAGDDEGTRFAYMGPIDEKTRPFCLTHAGKVYTRAEIDALDNGQLANVFLTGGGYNCRHVFTEISRFSELNDLKGKRVPEIQRALEALKQAA